MEQKSLKELQEQVNLFNATYGIGSKVTVKIESQIKLVTVVNKATIHSIVKQLQVEKIAVGWFKEISSFCSLDKVVNLKNK